MPCPNSARKRTISIAIRVSPEERDRIKLLCAATGKTQREILECAASNVSFVIESRGLWQERVKKEICFQYASKSDIFVRQLDLNQSNVNWNTMDSVTPGRPFHL